MQNFTNEQKSVIFRMLSLICVADGITHPKELEYMKRVKDDLGISQENESASEVLSVQQCKDVIESMPEGDKRNVLNLFLEMAAIDGYTDPREKLLLIGLGDTIYPKEGEIHTDVEIPFGKECILNLISRLQGSESFRWSVTDFVNIIFDKTNCFEDNCLTYLRNNYEDRSDMVPLQSIRYVSIYILECSGILNQAEEKFRQEIRDRLGIVIQYIDGLIDASERIRKGVYSQEIALTINNLKRSGYLYQPEMQFRKLICIFTIKPELLHEYMPAIFDALHSGNVIDMYKEPFSSSFVQVLEMYIRSKSDLCDINITDENDADLEYVIKALAIQKLIADNSKLQSSWFDKQLNLSRLFRYVSHLKISKPEVLIEKAFQCIDGNTEKKLLYGWSDTVNTTLLASKLSADEWEEPSGIPDIVYVGKKATVEIVYNQLLIRSNSNDGEFREVLPNKLLKWHNIQFMLDKNIKTGGIGNKEELSPLNKMWLLIERSLFSETSPKHSKVTHKKEFPGIGDDVLVWVKSQDCENPDSFYCVIEDENFEGEGILNIHNMVPYRIKYVKLEDFYYEGDALLIEVRVDNIKEDGTYIFSGLKHGKDFMGERFDYNKEYDCLILNKTQETICTVTSEGYTLNFQDSEDLCDLAVGDIVRAKYREHKRSGENIGYYVGSSNNFFDVQQAFRIFIAEYAYGIHNTQEKGVIEEQQKRVSMPRQHVKELIKLIDRKAVIESEYYNAYSYLAVARILCLIIEEESLAEYYSQRMKLIGMLNSLAVNGKIELSELSQMENMNAELVENYPALRRQFLELKTVSFQGSSIHDEELWKTIHSNDSKHLRMLATLSLAYNLLSSVGMSEHLEEIKVKTKLLLNLKDNSKQYRYFGVEGLHVEFKTSIVFPSNSNMRSDINAQTRHIMERVCGFMNAEGGTLYIGVNNEGYTSGIEHDLEYYLFRNGNSKDRYELHFRNSVIKMISKEASSLVDTHFEVDIDRTYFVVEIKQSLTVQDIEGTVYQRQGSTTTELSGTDLRNFRAQRNIQRQQLQEEASKSSMTEKRDTQELSMYEIDEKSKNVLSIGTSANRDNTLHDENIMDIVRYIHIRPNGKWYLTDNGYGNDDDSLILAVHDAEQDGYLILVYENGTVNKVLLSEMLEKQDWVEYVRYTDYNLVFATIAHNDDALLSISRNHKNVLHMRIDTINSFEIQKIKSGGKAIHEAEVLERIKYEIVPAAKRSVFARYENQKRSSLGLSISNQTSRAVLDSLHYLKIYVI